MKCGPSTRRPAPCAGRSIRSPATAGAGGANTWSRIVVDEANGLVFLPTGSASPDYFGGLRPGQDGHANSIVALRAATGEVAWSFQTVHHDLWDYDVASPPLLFDQSGDQSGDGPARPAVAVGSKTGHLFLFDRLTGTPLFPIRERGVPASDVVGERASPTQPFPSLPPSLVAQRVRAEDLWGATPEDLAACRETFKTLRNEGVFTPPSVRGTLVVPGNIGGLQWGGAAWDRTNRLIDRAGEQHPGGDPADSNGAIRRGTQSAPRAGNDGTVRRTLCDVAAVLPVAGGAAVRGAAVG